MKVIIAEWECKLCGNRHKIEAPVDNFKISSRAPSYCTCKGTRFELMGVQVKEYVAKVESTTT